MKMNCSCPSAREQFQRRQHTIQGNADRHHRLDRTQIIKIGTRHDVLTTGVEHRRDKLAILSGRCRSFSRCSTLALNFQVMSMGTMRRESPGGGPGPRNTPVSRRSKSQDSHCSSVVPSLRTRGGSGGGLGFGGAISRSRG